MENTLHPQPLDAIMIEYGLTNADLVKASTEQLTFKMVQKGRRGRRLTSNIQDKILTALMTAKPELKLRRRDLFRYEPNETVVEQIRSAIAQVRAKQIKYPQFVELLSQAGITAYLAEVGPNRITFYGTAGKAHTEQGSEISQTSPGRFDETALRLAITDAQKEAIDHPTFLKRIYEAGIATYEVNVRNRKIEYRGARDSYKENIPLPGEANLAVQAKPAEKKPFKKKKDAVGGMTRKARLALNKRRFQKTRKKRT
jgi:uncharacterized protein YbcV (DUF1398 family)